MSRVNVKKCGDMRAMKQGKGGDSQPEEAGQGQYSIIGTHTGGKADRLVA